LTAGWALADDVASATFLQAWRLYDVTLVEVRCSKVELDRRERVRGDRPVGLARSQAAVYAHGEFDIVVDTTSTSASTSHRTHTR
jgi:chloramphenicol 3-O-phosphotransferase